MTSLTQMFHSVVLRQERSQVDLRPCRRNIQHIFLALGQFWCCKAAWEGRGRSNDARWGVWCLWTFISTHNPEKTSRCCCRGSGVVGCCDVRFLRISRFAQSWILSNLFRIWRRHERAVLCDGSHLRLDIWTCCLIDVCFSLFLFIYLYIFFSLFFSLSSLFFSSLSLFCLFTTAIFLGYRRNQKSVFMCIINRQE